MSNRKKKKSQPEEDYILSIPTPDRRRKYWESLLIFGIEREITESLKRDIPDCVRLLMDDPDVEKIELSYIISRNMDVWKKYEQICSFENDFKKGGQDEDN